MKVYSVWSGEYSDRGVLAIFSTKDEAQKYMEIRMRLRPRDEFWIDEEEVYDKHDDSDAYPELFRIYITYNHAKNDIHRSAAYSEYEGEDMEISNEWEKGDCFGFSLLRRYIDEVRNPITDDRLLKIAQDRWAQFKARMEGIG